MSEPLAGPEGTELGIYRLGVNVSSTQTVAIDSLSVGETPRMHGIDVDHIQNLAESVSALPPILVHKATLQVIDGVHRLQALRLCGITTVDVQFYDGSPDIGYALSVRANVTHGLPLTRAERSEAAAHFIKSQPGWSDGLIANVSGLRATTVAKIRSSIPQGASHASRIGRDGRVRPLDGVAGRMRAAEFIEAHPDASVRKIANFARVSPSTALDVRKRVSSGRNPVPTRRRDESKVEPRELPVGEQRDRPTPALAHANWTDGIAKLRADPSIRGTEAGRELLRRLNVLLLVDDGGDHTVNAIPPHCFPLVASLARDCARSWQSIANKIERRIGPVTGRAS